MAATGKREHAGGTKLFANAVGFLFLLLTPELYEEAWSRSAQVVPE